MPWLVIVAIVLSFVASTALGQDVRTVVNAAVPDNAVSKNTIRAIFGVRVRKWSDGSPITVFVLPDNDPLHERFSKSQLNIFPHQLRRAWDRQVYSGTGQAPTEVANEEEMVRQLSETPGSIGYLSEDRVVPELKTLEIE
ncbi:MAG: hypothetical protein KDH88_13610 [Chromatiales bacterium]|nr:hypothetical protein [Chromatiales bacterium]